MTDNPLSEQIARRVRQVIALESAAILAIPADTLTFALPMACAAVLGCAGKVIVTGMGKNGHVARRIAATFCSTGTSAVFLHPGEAAHGDLGVLGRGDIVLALSNSGRTREVVETVARVKAHYADVPLIVVTGHAHSPLARLADHLLWYGDVMEPCPLGLTPSASLAAMSAMLDAVALAVMDARGFTRADFKRYHHQGYLSERIDKGI